MKFFNEKILVIDNESTTRHILVPKLTSLGYEVHCALDGIEALEIFKNEEPDLVILELRLPKLDGYGVCFQIREQSTVPIIILTMISNMADKITALGLGADDYLVKPFFPQELEARIRTVLKRSTLNPPIVKARTTIQKLIKIESLNIDLTNRCLYKKGYLVNLTVIEFNLLEFLLKNAGKPLSRTRILENLWGYKPERSIDTRIVDVNIARLRSKIEPKPSKPNFILTARGIGYFFRKYEKNVFS